MSTAHSKVWNGTAWVPGTDQGAGGVSLRTYQETIGDGRNSTFTVTHNLGTKDILIGIYETASGEEAEATYDRIDSSTIEVRTNDIIPFGSIRVLIIAL